MKHGVNGRRLFLFTGLIAVAAAYFYLKNTEDEKNYISRAAVARMTSLLDHTQEECEACAGLCRRMSEILTGMHRM